MYHDVMDQSVAFYRRVDNGMGVRRLRLSGTEVPSESS